MTQPRTQNAIVAAAALALVAYSTASFFDDRFPGWSMFSTFRQHVFEMHDGIGEPIELRSVMPRGAHLNQFSLALQVARFVCLKRRDTAAARPPYEVSDRMSGFREKLEADCEVRDGVAE